MTASSTSCSSATASRRTRPASSCTTSSSTTPTLRCSHSPVRYSIFGSTKSGDSQRARCSRRRAGRGAPGRSTGSGTRWPRRGRTSCFSCRGIFPELKGFENGRNLRFIDPDVPLANATDVAHDPTYLGYLSLLSSYEPYAKKVTWAQFRRGMDNGRSSFSTRSRTSSTCSCS